MRRLVGFFFFAGFLAGGVRSSGGFLRVRSRGGIEDVGVVGCVGWGGFSGGFGDGTSLMAG